MMTIMKAIGFAIDFMVILIQVPYMIIAGFIMCPKTDKTWRFGRRLLCLIVLTIIAGMLM